MGVELRPLGVKCNIQCQYCYQDPQRDAGNVNHRYDLARMKQALLDYGQPFTLFGGEPLLVPIEDIETLFSLGLSEFGHNSVQTNGSLITDAHIQLFKQYKVHVGISIDGPGELNNVRWAGNLELTRQATRKTENAIERLCREGMAPSLIVTLHRNNAFGEKIDLMRDWFRYLDGIGITSARLHVLEVDNELVRRKYALTAAENVTAFLAFAELEKSLTHLRFDVFSEMRKLLVGDDRSSTCVWNACDPYTTRAVQGVEGDGQRSNCGRTNKDGIDFTKADQPGFERYVALYHTPYESGGCAGCRFFVMCRGQCPGTAIDGDWRNRSEDCALWFSLFEHFERELIAQGQDPISVSEQRCEIEAAMIQQWCLGNSAGMHSVYGQQPHDSQAEATAHGDSHGDHTDSPG